MGKVLFALAALALIWLMPVQAGAQAVAPAASDDAVDADAPVDYGDPDAVDWGVPEHKLRVAPRGTASSPDIEKPYRRQPPEWPGEHLRQAYEHADAYAFPELFPSFDAAYQVVL